MPFILSVVVRNGQSLRRRRDEPPDHHGLHCHRPTTTRQPARTIRPPTIYRPATTRTSRHCAACHLLVTCILAASRAVTALVTCVLAASRAIAARRAHGCSPKCRDRPRGSAHQRPASWHELPNRHRSSCCLFSAADLCSQSLAIKRPVIGCFVVSHSVAIRLAAGRLSVGRPTTDRTSHRLTTGWSRPTWCGRSLAPRPSGDNKEQRRSIDWLSDTRTKCCFSRVFRKHDLSKIAI